MALSAEEELVVQEWSPLTHLFQKLPTKHMGFFSTDLKLTCVDAISELIVMGTNMGIVYCYNRKTHNMERLKCENVNIPITRIKVTSTVDYMLAVGNKEGNVNIFQVPKVPPASLPANLRPKDKQVERYSVMDMHKGHVTALEWSKNGMKLFSGDATGHVVLTEIDFYMHLCKSSEILDEAYEIVQLNYVQQRLLVSTVYRSIICQKQDKWKVCQVGKKDRKLLGPFGGTIMQTGLGPSDLVLFCVRPGLRIWQADLSGSVEKTILFKESLNKASPDIMILNPMPASLKRAAVSKEPCFGTIHQFHENYLVTRNAHSVYVLNVKEMKVVGVVNQLRGVLDVAVHKDEIFVLESERSLIRISPFPEYADAPLPPSTPTLTTSLKELGNKLQAGSAVVAATPTKSAFPLRSAAVAAAEEAVEVRRASPLRTAPTTPVTPTEGPADHAYQVYRKLEVYNKIATQDFDEVIGYTHRRKVSRRQAHLHAASATTTNAMTASTCSYSSNSSGEGDRWQEAYTIHPTVMSISTVGLLIDAKSPDALLHDINEKENLLAELLNFDSVKVDMKQLHAEPTVRLYDAEPEGSEVMAYGDSRPEVDQNLFPELSSKPPAHSKPSPSFIGSKASDKKHELEKIPAYYNIPKQWSVQDLHLDVGTSPKPRTTAGLAHSNISNVPLRQPKEISFQPTSPPLDLSEWEIV